MSKNAADLIKWDVISFRRSGERAWQSGIVYATDEQTFAGMTFVIATVEVCNKKQLLNITPSLEWNFVYNMAEAAA